MDAAGHRVDLQNDMGIQVLGAGGKLESIYNPKIGLVAQEEPASSTIAKAVLKKNTD